MLSKAYDVIIVGAGTSGSLLSRNLSKSGLKTLLLEAGPSNLVTPSAISRAWIHVPIGYLYTLKKSYGVSYGYKTTINTSCTARTIEYPRGRTLGGCSSINGMIYQKGNKGDYDGWNVSNWKSEDMRRAFEGIQATGLWPCEKQVRGLTSCVGYKTVYLLYFIPSLPAVAEAVVGDSRRLRPGRH